MSKLSVLMTVYNEAEFVEQAIQSCLPHVDHLVVVEGAYQETIALGAAPRSTDGTFEKVLSIIHKDCKIAEDLSGEELLKKIDNPSKIHLLQTNEQTDKDQRNVGLHMIKELNPDGWLLIIDGDEVYTKANFQMVKVAMKTMAAENKYGAYFKSLTFVNDLKHYTEQEFPRLFKITPECTFTDDNFMIWKEYPQWGYPHIKKIPQIKYHHYAFCKGNERFELKKKWWETRFGKPFDYGWKVEDGKIDDDNHQILEYTGKHPKIMESHPQWKRDYEV